MRGSRQALTCLHFFQPPAPRCGIVIEDLVVRQPQNPPGIHRFPEAALRQQSLWGEYYLARTVRSRPLPKPRLNSAMERIGRTGRIIVSLVRPVQVIILLHEGRGQCGRHGERP